MARCEVYAELQAEVDKSLEKLRELTTLQLEVFRSNNYHSFMRMDKELEVAVGEKERTIGALNSTVESTTVSRQSTESFWFQSDSHVAVTRLSSRVLPSLD